MKQLIVIIGSNAVGKSSTAKALVEQCEKTAYVDSDWCRVMNPFEFTEVTKQTVRNNIYCLLRNYLVCDEIENVVFTYGWHGERKEIYESVIEKLRKNEIEFKENIIILRCTRDENRKRAIQDGRDDIRVNRGMEMTFSFYEKYEYPCIDTTEMTPSQVAKIIADLLKLI